MENLSKLLGSIALLLWPLMVVFVILLFKPAVMAIIESGKFRRFSLKIGGQELTMEEANEQQRNLITDLQAQVVDLRNKIEGGVQVQPTAPKPTVPIPSAQGQSVLWVDDEPKNNSFFVQHLSDKGVRVDLALSTTAGLDMYDHGNYSVIISDMGRKEDGSYNADAGLDLLKGIRKRSRDVPFIIYSSSAAARDYGDQAIALGATGITSSPTELLRILGNQLSQLAA